MKRNILIFIAIAVILAGLVFIIRTLYMVVPSYPTAKQPDINTAPMRIYGIIEPAHREVFIAPPLVKRVEGILVHENDTVVKGQPLVELDSVVEKAQLATAKANVAVAKAAFAINQDKWQRNVNLFNKQVVNEFDYAQSDLQVKYDAMHVEKTVKEMEQAQMEVDRLTLRSPIDGKVYHVNVHLGQAFTPDARLFIVGEKDLWVHLSVESYWINRIADVPYKVYHADTQEFLGTAKLIRSGAYMGPGHFQTEDPSVMVDLKYEDAYLSFHPIKENLPIRLVVYVEQDLEHEG